MRIALCDDNTVYIEYLKKTILSYLKNDVTIQTFHSAEAMLFDIGETIPYDLLILDIQMGRMNGMDLAKQIRMKDSNVFIVFITGITDYVFDGYEVGALRYLLKPLKEPQLFQILEDVKLRLSSDLTRYLILNISGEKVKIDLNDIIYLEVYGHYVVIHTTRNEYEIKKSMLELIKEIDSDLFISVHRSFVVNIKHVEKINKDSCILSNQAVVNVSRSNYQKLNEKFILYIRGINHD